MPGATPRSGPVSQNDQGLVQSLEAFGAARQRVRVLDGGVLAPQQMLDYADLIALARREGALAVEAVVEVDHRPAIYVARRPLLPAPGFDDDLRKLHRRLSCRGREAYLAVADQGRLTVYRCALARERPEPFLVREVGAPDAAGLIPGLIGGSFWQPGWDEAMEPPAAGRAQRRGGRVRAKTRAAEAESVHDVLLTSIVGVAKALQGSAAVADLEQRSGLVLCLVGRALLLRFLIDRGILDSLPQAEAVGASGGGVRAFLDTAAGAAAACVWLDDTFNGDLLPLPLPNGYAASFALIEAGDPAFFPTLGCLMRAEENGQLRLALWDQLDFAYVPVGILSEVYDDFTRHVSREVAVRTSVHFTPAPIAEYALDQALGALQGVEPADARLLDPAVGAGIFLTVGFRRMYAALWTRCLAQGRARPGTKPIRDMLYGQLRGFDINPDALNLAALSLYLTAIELDPDPSPPRRLRFDEPLMGKVLFDVRTGCAPELGSLVPGAMPDHLATYDIVAGNPPWTAISGEPGVALDKAAVRIAAVAIDRLSAPTGSAEGVVPGGATPSGEGRHAYRNPDHVPDLPFVWQSLGWAKPGGVIALVLHGRLLFKATAPALRARSLLFSTVRVTGIVDGSGVSEAAAVWPGVSAPFCILFASNSPGDRAGAFNYVSPVFEGHINRTGRFRLDPRNVHLVSPAELDERPTLLKLLSKGDSLDLDLIWKMSGPISVQATSTPLLPLSYPPGFLLDFGNGQSQDDLEMLGKLAGTIAPGRRVVPWTTVVEYLERLGLRRCSGFQEGEAVNKRRTRTPPENGCNTLILRSEAP